MNTLFRITHAKYSNHLKINMKQLKLQISRVKLFDFLVSMYSFIFNINQVKYFYRYLLIKRDPNKIFRLF